MSYLESALAFDASDNPVEAANAYEEAIKQEDVGLDAFMNLAVLYFECTDPGYFCAKKLDQEFINRASAGMFRVLEQSYTRFGHQPEALFWKLYFDWFSKFADPRYDDCRQLAKATPVACLHLLGEPDGKAYCEPGLTVPQAEALLQAVKSRKTVRERYIDSVVRSWLNIARHSGRPL